MPKFSVCLITHNEQENLRRTLESIAWADEIILVDCESTDATVEIAQKFTDKIYHRPNNSNLNINKNYAFDQATGDWLLCLDADEIIPQDLKNEIQEVTSRENTVQGFFLKRKNYYFGNWLQHGGQYPDLQLRLFRRGKGRFPEEHVHERMRIEGKVGMLTSPFDHNPYPSISHYLKKVDFYTNFEAKKLKEKGVTHSFSRAVYYIIFRPMKRFFSRYLLKRGFLDGVPGFLASFFDSMNQVITYGKFFFETKNNE